MSNEPSTCAPKNPHDGSLFNFFAHKTGHVVVRVPCEYSATYRLHQRRFSFYGAMTLYHLVEDFFAYTSDATLLTSLHIT